MFLGEGLVAEHEEFTGVENWITRIAARARPTKELSISVLFLEQSSSIEYEKEERAEA